MLFCCFSTFLRYTHLFDVNGFFLCNRNLKSGKQGCWGVLIWLSRWEWSTSGKLDYFNCYRREKGAHTWTRLAVARENMLSRHLASFIMFAREEISWSGPNPFLHNCLPANRVHPHSLQRLLRLHWAKPLPCRTYSHGLGLWLVGDDQHGDRG